MQNPLLKNKKATLLYLTIWLAIAGLELCFGFYYYKLPFKTLLLDVLLQQGLLAFIYLGLWYPLRFFNPSLLSWTVLFLNHGMVLILILLVWVPLTRFITNYSFNVDDAYFDAITPLKFIIAVFTYLLYVLFVYLYENYNRVLENQKNEQVLLQNLKEAELSLLRNQLNPHFLFNSLNSISSLTLLDPEKAHEMVIKLSDFLRYTVTNSQLQKVSLAQEMDMCRAYLDIEKIRFGDKIALDIHVESDTEKLQIPSLLLQPLFENALKHGVHTSLKTESIHMRARKEMAMLLIEISNSVDSEQSPSIGTKSGLKNIRDRLKLMYKNNASIDTIREEGRFVVKLTLPIG
jgi:two-component system, LytTR family, sensor kinase